MTLQAGIWGLCPFPVSPVLFRCSTIRSFASFVSPITEVNPQMAMGILIYDTLSQYTDGSNIPVW